MSYEKVRPSGIENRQSLTLLGVVSCLSTLSTPVQDDCFHCVPRSTTVNCERIPIVTETLCLVYLLNIANLLAKDNSAPSGSPPPPPPLFAFSCSMSSLTRSNRVLAVAYLLNAGQRRKPHSMRSHICEWLRGTNNNASHLLFFLLLNPLVHLFGENLFLHQPTCKQQPK